MAGESQTSEKYVPPPKAGKKITHSKLDSYLLLVNIKTII